MTFSRNVPLRFSSDIAEMDNWRVLLAESHPQIRQDMVKVLSEMPGLSLVAKVTNGWDVMFTSSQLKPDIMLLDFDLPGLNGIEVTSLIKRGLPEVPIVILLSDGEEDERHLRAIEQCGACAYLLKTSLAQQLPSLLGKLERSGKGRNSSDEGQGDSR